MMRTIQIGNGQACANLTCENAFGDGGFALVVIPPKEFGQRMLPSLVVPLCNPCREALTQHIQDVVQDS